MIKGEKGKMGTLTLNRMRRMWFMSGKEG